MLLELGALVKSAKTLAEYPLYTGGRIINLPMCWQYGVAGYASVGCFLHPNLCFIKSRVFFVVLNAVFTTRL